MKKTGFEKDGALDQAIKSGSEVIKQSAEAIAAADKTYGDGLPWNQHRVAMDIQRDGERWDELNGDVGKKLCWGRARLPHGEFESWVTDEVGINQETARWFMRCFEYNTETDKRIRGAIGKTKSRHLYLLPDKILERVRDQYEKTGKIGDFTLDQLMEMVTREVGAAIRKTRDRNRDMERQHKRNQEKMRENERLFVTRDAGNLSSPYNELCRRMEILERETVQYLQSAKDVEQRRKDANWLGIRLESWRTKVGQIGELGELVPFPNLGGTSGEEPEDDI